MISKKLQSLGVTEADDQIYPRLILAVSGPNKKGKTNFGLTAPDPSLIISSDIGTEGVVDKFVKAGKKIYEYQWLLPEKQEDAQKVWLEMKKVYDAALEEKDLRSIIIDTESETWELLRLYKFGKLDKVPDYKYGEVNAISKRMYKSAYQYKKNLILLRQQKKRYVNGNWDGTYEASGFNKTNEFVQEILEVGRYPRSKNDKNPDFYIDIIDSRHDASKAGTRLEGPMCTFQFLANELLPDVDIDFWE